MKSLSNTDQVYLDFLKNSRSVVLVVLDSQWKILSHNGYFQDSLGVTASIKGKSFLPYLMDESIKHLEDVGKSPKTHIKMVLKGIGNVSVPLDCTIYKEGDTIILIGEKPMLTNDETMQKMTTMNIEMVNLTRELQKKNRELQYANSTIKTLRGILPICSFCKGIRDDEGYWKKLEEYVTEATEAEFSHSICPRCMEMHYPEIFEGN